MKLLLLPKKAAKKLLWRLFRTPKLKKKIRESFPLRLIIGSSGTEANGWIGTEVHDLNLLNIQDWDNLLGPCRAERILAEHVWEHLTLEDGTLAAKTCYKYLTEGGKVRVAVPDGLFPDDEYIEYVKPGGHGDGSDDHKVLYTYSMLKDVFSAAGFKCQLLEYFDESGQFKKIDWDISDGMISRSAQFDSRNSDGKLKYTSIILDATK